MDEDWLPSMTFGQWLVRVDKYMMTEYPDAVMFLNDAPPMLQQQASGILWASFLTLCQPQECCGRLATLSRQYCGTLGDA